MSRAALTTGTLFGDEPVRNDQASPLKAKFIIPPFSVLNAASDEWKKRKRLWLALGIESEIGRNANAYDLHDWCSEVDNMGQRTDFAHGWKAGGVSVFDPVLCELVYNWFSPVGGRVLDPFAGGSVRGIVADRCGLAYQGIELRAEQVEANRSQADRIGSARAEWIAGDSFDKIDGCGRADLLFSCPPYGDLERYSDDPRDLSSLSWGLFSSRYRTIIARAVERLSDNRFAVFVVGNFRSGRGKHDHGQLRDLVGLTVSAFEEAGAGFHNEAVLIQPFGTLPVRTGKQFTVSRKMGKAHQNVLVFVKGDARAAAKACGAGAL
jgi:hypothetical protein